MAWFDHLVSDMTNFRIIVWWASLADGSKRPPDSHDDLQRIPQYRAGHTVTAAAPTAEFKAVDFQNLDARLA